MRGILNFSLSLLVALPIFVSSSLSFAQGSAVVEGALSSAQQRQLVVFFQAANSNAALAKNTIANNPQLAGLLGSLGLQDIVDAVQANQAIPYSKADIDKLVAAVKAGDAAAVKATVTSLRPDALATYDAASNDVNALQVNDTAAAQNVLKQVASELAAEGESTAAINDLLACTLESCVNSQAAVASIAKYANQAPTNVRTQALSTVEAWAYGEVNGKPIFGSSSAVNSDTFGEVYGLRKSWGITNYAPVLDRVAGFASRELPVDSTLEQCFLAP